MPHEEFLRMFRAAFGSPALAALILASVVYAYAALQRIRHSQECLTTALLAFCVIGIDTTDLLTLSTVQTWPLWTAAAFQLAINVREHRSSRTLIILLCAATAIRFSTPADWPTWLRNGTWLGLVECSLIAVGWCYRDNFARTLRPLSAWVLFFTTLRLLARPDLIPVWAPSFTVPLGVIVLGGLAVWCSRYLGSLAWYFLGWLIGASGALMASIVAYAFLKQFDGPISIDSLLIGMACFALAVLISTYKGGLLQKLAPLLPGPPQIVGDSPSAGK